MPGDINNQDNINNADAQWLLEHLAQKTGKQSGTEQGYTLEQFKEQCKVVNPSGTVFSCADASYIYSHVKEQGNTNNYPITLPEPEPEPEQSTVWVKKIQSSPDGWEGIYNMDIDSNNNIYVVAAFYEDITFAGQTLVYTGDNSHALLKYDSNGNEVWGKITPGVTSPWYSDITISSNNDVYITNYASTTITFANEIITHTEGNLSEIVLFKYDSDGNEIWAKMIGGISWDAGYGVTTDSNNNVYLVGFATNAIIFANQTLTLTEDDNSDSIILKYDSNGNEIWGRSVGGLGLDEFYKVKIDSLDNIYVIGRVLTSMTFAGQTYTSTTPKTNIGELIIVKYDSNGNEIWGKMYECLGNFIRARSITLDSNNNLYITGGISGSITFANQTITSYATAVNNSDAFIFKLDSNGNDIWIKHYNNSTNLTSSTGHTSAIDSNNKLYLVGLFSNTTTFGNITTEPLATDPNPYILQMNLDGTELSVDKYSIDGWGYINSLKIDSNDKIYVVGEIGGSITIAGETLNAGNGSFGFVSKIA